MLKEEMQRIQMFKDRAKALSVAIKKQQAIELVLNFVLNTVWILLIFWSGHDVLLFPFLLVALLQDHFIKLAVVRLYVIPKMKRIDEQTPKPPTT